MLLVLALIVGVIYLVVNRSEGFKGGYGGYMQQQQQQQQQSQCGPNSVPCNSIPNKNRWQALFCSMPIFKGCSPKYAAQMPA